MIIMYNVSVNDATGEVWTSNPTVFKSRKEVKARVYESAMEDFGAEDEEELNDDYLMNKTDNGQAELYEFDNEGRREFYVIAEVDERSAA